MAFYYPGFGQLSLGPFPGISKSLGKSEQKMSLSENSLSLCCLDRCQDAGFYNPQSSVTNCIYDVLENSQGVLGKHTLFKSPVTINCAHNQQ